MSEKETDTETEEEVEEDEKQPEIEKKEDPQRIYTYKVFKSNNGKCIAKGLERRGN